VKERGIKENRPEAESQLKEKNPVFCREDACCQKVTLNIFEVSDWPSRMAESVEEAQGVGNAVLAPQCCIYILH